MKAISNNRFTCGKPCSTVFLILKPRCSKKWTTSNIGKRTHYDKHFC